MDPQANLAEQRELVAKLAGADETAPGFAEDARRLAAPRRATGPHERTTPCP